MSRPRSGDPFGLLASWGGSGTSGGFTSGRAVQVLVSEDLTRAMIFSPLGAAVAGLATIIALAAWASRGNRGLGLVSKQTMASALATDTSGSNCPVSHHRLILLDRFRNQHGNIRQSSARCPRSPTLPAIWTGPIVHFWSCNFPSTRCSCKSRRCIFSERLIVQVAISAALAWAIYEYQREHSEPSRRGSESADPLSNDHQRWTEKERR